MWNEASRLGATLLLGASLSGPLGVARAQAPQGAVAAEAEVEPLVQRGIELRRVGRDPEALIAFRDALVRSPSSSRVKVHLASTHQALGQWVEAERYLSEALRAVDDPYIRRHRPTLEKAYEFVERRVGSLDVVGGPEGAELVLSGRNIGRLPLAAPVRIPIGSYVLEVRKDGYYPVSRPIAIGGGTLLRESVTLGPRLEPTAAFESPRAAVPDAADSRGGAGWLTWTLAGVGVGAAAVSVLAFSIRERHADRWNDEACLEAGLTRGEVCSAELDAGRSAERWGIGAGIVSGVLLGGAAATLIFAPRTPNEAPGLALDGCGVGAAGARCFGSF